MAKKPYIKKLNLSFRGNLNPLSKSRIVKIVQHHMAHPSWDIMDVHNFHRYSNGWQGIGYNFWIGFDGTIYEARGLYQGAHCLGYNSTTIGIGYQGNFQTQHMTDAQLKAGIALNVWLIDEFPNLQAGDILGHKDLGSTACPGKNFRMSELKKGVSGGKVEAPKQEVESEITNKWTKVTGDWKGQTLGNGEYGEPVRQLQTMLAENDPPFYPNKGARNNGIDSYYGDNTENAVTRYQSYYGLSVDGLAGKEVYGSLTGKSSSNKPASKPKSSGLPNAVYKAAKPYPRGSGVKAVQKALASVYFYPNKGAKNKGIDGVYGPNTADAVQRFQSMHGLAQDGIYGPDTKKALEKAM
ncbi:peptidoglycan recognition protein family protein [Virgibacillus salexigens]|uniref:peptidoglycan recognition protein family protein n=1 Tax=Virgibacillus salexigens TaxID=61016 RepID=UPI00190BD726|nr:N-acetylmuramoyl-L-alanine amidase [Virgibacillus salexigens]